MPLKNGIATTREPWTEASFTLCERCQAARPTRSEAVGQRMSSGVPSW